MKNTFGQSVSLTIFGESHGPAVGVVLDGLAPGLPVDEAYIDRQLARRRPATAMDTPRREPDHYRILSGVFQGRTTGSPIAIVIPNENTRSEDYTYGLARPSHADYAAYCKYHGHEDWRGGGHFSGRVTAPLVAAGAILLSALSAAGITCTEYTFTDSNDVSSVTQKACDDSDVLYIPTDNTAASNTEAIANVVLAAGTPVIAGEAGICRGCGVATLSIDYYELGKITGQMSAKILTGEADISTMPVEFAPTATKQANMANCEKLGITVPADYTALATE